MRTFNIFLTRAVVSQAGAAEAELLWALARGSWFDDLESPSLSRRACLAKCTHDCVLLPSSFKPRARSTQTYLGAAAFLPPPFPFPFLFPAMVLIRKIQ